jgi:hypothetical protein
MALADFLTFTELDYLFYPNWSFGIAMFIGIPLAIIYGISYTAHAMIKFNSY